MKCASHKVWKILNTRVAAGFNRSGGKYRMDDRLKGGFRAVDFAGKIRTQAWSPCQRDSQSKKSAILPKYDPHFCFYCEFHFILIVQTLA